MILLLEMKKKFQGGSDLRFEECLVPIERGGECDSMRPRIKKIGPELGKI